MREIEAEIKRLKGQKKAIQNKFKPHTSDERAIALNAQCIAIQRQIRQLQAAL